MAAAAAAAAATATATAVAGMSAASGRVVRLLLPKSSAAAGYVPDAGDIRLAYYAGQIYVGKEELDHLLCNDTPSVDHPKEIRQAYLSGRIDAKKEELYKLISEQIQSSYAPSRKVSKARAQLLANLSAHIDPKIDDPLWFKSVRARRMERLYTFLGSHTFMILAAVGACELIALAEDPTLHWLNKRKKLAMDWWNKQLN